MRHEIIIGSSSTAEVHGPPAGRSVFQQLKSIVLAFLALCAIVGVLLAAFVVGVVLAGLVLLGIVIAVGVWFASRFWRRRT